MPPKTKHKRQKQPNTDSASEDHPNRQYPTKLSSQSSSQAIL